ncbi:MAG TPA: substrate-binding domain-containing protein [Verrucomicrobiota bacterium]|nr:substrate-binding domain-containing protein [Verrucomicrobiota bacterium]
MNPRLALVIVSLLLGAAIGASLARRGAAAPARGPAAGRTPLIGLSLDTLKEERWVRDRDRFVAKARELGAEVLVQAANSDDARQIQDVESLISRGVDVIVIVPHDGAAMAKGVAAAKKAGIPVISYDRLITGADVDVYLSFDNVRVGRLQAEYLVNKLGGKGRIVRIYGSKTDNNALLFKQGQDEILQPLIAGGAIQVVHEDWALDWRPENAKRIMNAALTARGRDGRILVTGQDADLAACQRILRGTQTMTIYKPLARLADRAAQTAVDIARRAVLVANGTVDNGFKPVPAILEEVIAVDRENLMDTVVKDGFHRAEDLK